MQQMWMFDNFLLKYEIEVGKAHKELLPFLSAEAVKAIRLSSPKYRRIGRHMVLEGWDGSSSLCSAAQGKDSAPKRYEMVGILSECQVPEEEKLWWDSVTRWNDW
ncbi:MAG: hypothetical protein M0009_06575 [Deltaproteobacteria bacterium]|nr:hypothetical protein [Deltaproteobacteria bacterium]